VRVSSDRGDVITRELGRKAVRYSAVSVVGVAVTQVFLLTLHGVFGWPGTAANVTAVCVASVPAYFMNRQWVWGRRGDHDLAREVLPFWGFAFAGLAFSTVLVALADQWSTSPLAVSAANITAFGTLWVVKFFVLDMVMFGKSQPEYAPDYTLDVAA
jgi:putative flippase GtrA